MGLDEAAMGLIFEAGNGFGRHHAQIEPG